MKRLLLLIILITITINAQTSYSDIISHQNKGVDVAIKSNTDNLSISGKESANGYTVYKISNNVSPNQYTLEQNYPNPFNPSTKIKFSIPKESDVKLVVYNMLGQTVSTIYDGRLEAGTHYVEFNGSSIPSGIYFYRLEAENFVKIKKMTLVK